MKAKHYDLTSISKNATAIQQLWSLKPMNRYHLVEIIKLFIYILALMVITGLIAMIFVGCTSAPLLQPEPQCYYCGWYVGQDVARDCNALQNIPEECAPFRR